MFFLASKTLLSHLGTIINKIFFINFEHYDLAKVRNECVRVGGHIDIQVTLFVPISVYDNICTLYRQNLVDIKLVWSKKIKRCLKIIETVVLPS
jgi:hypothetical protein